jgi:hypothetical protein
MLDLPLACRIANVPCGAGYHLLLLTPAFGRPGILGRLAAKPPGSGCEYPVLIIGDAQDCVELGVSQRVIFCNQFPPPSPLLPSCPTSKVVTLPMPPVSDLWAPLATHSPETFHLCQHDCLLCGILGNRLPSPPPSPSRVLGVCFCVA